MKTPHLQSEKKKDLTESHANTQGTHSGEGAHTKARACWKHSYRKEDTLHVVDIPVGVQTGAHLHQQALFRKSTLSSV